MRLRIGNELILLNMLVFALVVAIIFFPSNVLRIIPGIPVLLFFPGYTLIAALFPRRNALDSIERVALSFGLSIAVVPLIGLIPNYTPWGIRLEPILISLTIFIVVISIVTWYRQLRLAQVERLTVSFNLSLPPWRGQSSVDKILSIILIVAILGAVGTLGYVIATPRVGETFTEFYLLGLEGKATDYPREVTVGKEGKVIVGIVNHEHEVVSYRVEVMMDGVKNNEIKPVVLEHNEKWEEEITFIPEKAGENQKVEFLLFKEGRVEPYLKLDLWLDVTE